MRHGVAGQRSFSVHGVVALLVVVAGVVLRVSLVEWCILIVCITLVMTAEMFNSALEAQAKAIDLKENRQLADALDIASGAVLVASLGAALVGAIIFIFRLGVLLDWWRMGAG